MLFDLLCSAEAKSGKVQVSSQKTLTSFHPTLVLEGLDLCSPGSGVGSVFMIRRNITRLPHLFLRGISIWGWDFPVVWRSWGGGGEAICEEGALQAELCQEDLWVLQ